MRGVLLLAVLALMGCGQSASQKDAETMRKDQQAIQQLSRKTQAAGEAGRRLKEAEAQHRKAVERLRALEHP